MMASILQLLLIHRPKGPACYSLVHKQGRYSSLVGPVQLVKYGHSVLSLLHSSIPIFHFPPPPKGFILHVSVSGTNLESGLMLAYGTSIQLSKHRLEGSVSVLLSAPMLCYGKLKNWLTSLQHICPLQWCV